MFDALTIGSALADIFISSQDFELQKTGDGIFLCQMYGAKIEVDSFALHTGGGAGNVAVGLARAGLSVGTIVELGSDSLAKMVVEDLERAHVDTSYVVRERLEQTGGSVILIGNDGGRTIMVHRGAASQLDPKDISERAIERASRIHLSSVGGRLPALKRIGELAHMHKKPLSWNPGSAELALLAGGELSVKDFPCHILIMNRQEWEMVSALEDEIRASVAEIIITDGRNGLELIHEGKSTNLPAGNVSRTVDETGAGDAFASGYVAARFHSLDVAAAAVWGVRNASSVVGQLGGKAGLLSYNELAS